MQQEFVQNLKNVIMKSVNSIHTAFPGEIKSFDSSTGLAVITPKAKYKKPNGETIDYPELYNVPVCLPNSGDVMIAYPIEAGDSCLVICSEIPLDLWRYGKETSTDLKFDLTSAIAIPNISSETNDALKTACEENAVVVKAGDNTVKINEDGVTVTTKKVTATVGTDTASISTDGASIAVNADSAEITAGETVISVLSNGVTITGNVVVSGSLSSGGSATSDDSSEEEEQPSEDEEETTDDGEGEEQSTDDETDDNTTDDDTTDSGE